MTRDGEGFRPQAMRREDRPDGTVRLTCPDPLPPVAAHVGDWLDRWAAAAPERVFLAERSGAGWRTEGYAAVAQAARAIATALAGRGLGPDRPLAVLSGNSVDHGLIALGAQLAGVPVVPLAEQYALIGEAHPRLVHALDLVRPGMAYVDDAGRFADALALSQLAGVEVVASRVEGAPRPVTGFAELLRGDPGAALPAIGPDTVAKYLLTSGSTSAPKAVVTTQRMVCVNQAQIAAALPFLADRPPVILDWLPWNHVFGGSHNFNMMLANGGSLWIDDGRPVPGGFDRTLENLAMVAGTLSFNVPVGYAMLARALADDAALRRRFFGELDLVFYAGAALPPEVWTALEDMGRAVRGRAPLMASSWGMTETAPACVMVHDRSGGAGIIGVPLPGVTVKLMPAEDGRHELRVAGPNVMPGYLGAPQATAAGFDDEGFLVTGDAVRFVDPDRLAAGLKFDGRVSEDFKLMTGTWVRAAALRLEVLAWLAPLAADVVICGQDRAEVGLLVVPDRAACAAAGLAVDGGEGLVAAGPLTAEIGRRMRAAAGRATGSAGRVARAAVLVDPPSLAAGELTAKGNINIRKLLDRRAGLLARLYAADDPDVVRLEAGQ
ncbi:MAG: AMP-binding protein [Rhodobacteraceae bacterium]|nr:AMP-binding protein [Paracoccaceae bacterium]